MAVATSHGWWAIAGSVLRMELDSMIRVIYLLHTPDARDRILARCVAGEGFKDGKSRIYDVDMKKVAVADNEWVDAVYDFGSKFVHLTDAHDYAKVDPFQAYEHKGKVIEYLNAYHGARMRSRPLDEGSTLDDIAAYGPHVLDKITSNLNFYTRSLRAAVGQNR